MGDVEMMRSRVVVWAKVLCLLASVASAQAPGYSSRDEFGIGAAASIEGREVKIAAAWGQQLRPPEQYPRAVTNLGNAILKWTGLPVSVESQFRIENASSEKAAVLFVMADKQFQLSPTEKSSLKKYIAGGGFLVLDDAGAGLANSPSGASLRQMVKDIAGGRHLEPVPPEHAIYTTPFPLGGPPQGSDGAVTVTGTKQILNSDGTTSAADVFTWGKEAAALEGVFIDGRLAILYSPKGYTPKWDDDANDPQLKFGVNLISYAASTK